MYVYQGCEHDRHCDSGGGGRRRRDGADEGVHRGGAGIELPHHRGHQQDRQGRGGTGEGMY